MAKYEKVGEGTYGVYKKKKESGCAPIIGGVFIFIIIMALLNECSGAEVNAESLPQSHLAPVPDDPGVFRYVEGDGSIAALTLSAQLSRTGDRLVILTATTQKYEVQALAHAKKLSGWLQEEIEDISTVPIIIYPNEKGVGYTFHINGLRYIDPTHGKNGIMNPQESASARERAKYDYQASIILADQNDAPPLNTDNFEQLLDYQIAKSKTIISLMETQRDHHRLEAEKAFNRARQAEQLLKTIQK